MARISVVIPTRDRWNLTLRAVESAVNQSVKPQEVIVVDDGSMESPLMESVIDIDSIVRIIRYQPGVNAAFARNRGIDGASGEWVAFLDSDDWWLKDHLSNAMRVMKAQEAVGVVGAYRAVYSSNCEEVHAAPGHPEGGADGMIRYLYEEGGIARMSTMVVHSLILRDVHFDERLNKHQDWDFAITVAGEGRVSYNPQADVCVDHAASQRMSGKANPDATLLFLRKYEKMMRPRARNGFLLWTATSATLRQDRRAVSRILAELHRPMSIFHRLKALSLRIIVGIPTLPRVLSRLYVLIVGIRSWRKERNSIPVKTQ